jgi:hypothetical protein
MSKHETLVEKYLNENIKNRVEVKAEIKVLELLEKVAIKYKEYLKSIEHSNDKDTCDFIEYFLAGGDDSDVTIKEFFKVADILGFDIELILKPEF